MRERELEMKFIEFLLSEKGYSKGSIMSQAPLQTYKYDSDRSYRYIADLIIIDLEFNKYLALIEFKTRQEAFKGSLQQVKTYLDLVNQPNLPGYLVLTKSEQEDDFSIYVLDDNKWTEVAKEDFPHYDTLRSKNQADEKINLEDINASVLREKNKKRALIKSTAWSTIISLIAGLVVALSVSEKFFPATKDSGNKNNNSTCCDTISQKVNKIDIKLNDLRNDFLKIKINDSLSSKRSNDRNLNILQERVIALENIINQSPEKLLKIQALAYDLKSQKELLENDRDLNSIKFMNMKEKIDTLWSLTLGLLVATIGSLLAFAFNALRK